MSRLSSSYDEQKRETKEKIQILRKELDSIKLDSAREKEKRDRELKNIRTETQKFASRCFEQQKVLRERVAQEQEEALKNAVKR